MQYLGGKFRLGKQIAEVLNKEITRKQALRYYEPFVGGANVLIHVKCNERFASDVHRPLIALWCAIQQGWIPPETVTEQEYVEAKAKIYDTTALTAFIGFGCSFGGKYFGGYARGGESRNYAKNAKNSLMRKQSGIVDVKFSACDYTHLCQLPNSVVYCDPPYANMTSYTTGVFDADGFWDVVRQWSVDSSVFVSEYQAPRDFECVAEFQTKTDLRVTDGSKEARIEKLFTLAKAAR